MTYAKAAWMENHCTARASEGGHPQPRWFLGNVHVLVLSIGLVGPGLGLSVAWTMLAGTLGILFGAVFMAFHAAPQVLPGWPPMLRSPASLDDRGMLPALLATLCVLVGFNVVNVMLAIQGMRSVFGIDAATASAITIVSGTALAICGPRLVRNLFAWASIMGLPLYAVLTIALSLVDTPHMHSLSLAPPPGFGWMAFFTQFAIGAGFPIAYSPCVSGGIRPLHAAGPNTRMARLGLGTAFSGAWMIGLGACLAQQLHTTDALACIDEIGNALVPGFGRLAAVVSLLGLLPIISLNTHGAMRVALAAFDGASRVRAGGRHRAVAIVTINALLLACVFAIHGHSPVLLHALLPWPVYVLMPWAAIRLVERFLARKGPHGVARWRCIAAYLAGCVAMAPFFPALLAGSDREVFSDYFVRSPEGLDIAWLIGLAATATVYVLLAQSIDLHAGNQASRREEQPPGVGNAAVPRGRMA